MSSHELTDKSLLLEGRLTGMRLEGGRPFSEPAVEAHYGPDHDAQLVHMEVELRIDPTSPGLRSTARLRIAPLPGRSGPLRLHLEDLCVRSVMGSGGQPLAHEQRPGLLVLEQLPEDGQFTVICEGRPERGLYFTGPTRAEPGRPFIAWTQCQDEDARFLFPCQDHPSVKHPWTIHILAPTGQTVVSNGRLVAQVEDGAGWTRWTWQQPEPMPAYLFSAVVGELVRVQDRLGDLPIDYYAPAGTSEQTLRRVFGKTPRMVAHLAQTYGLPYPWPRYDQVVVQDFVFGGMENVAATTLTDMVLTDERAALDWDAEDLIAHELAHQWFGDLVTCQDWSQGWLNEGWATWSEWLWRKADLGAQEADYALFGQLNDYLDEDASRYRRTIVHYGYRSPIDLFDRHLYEKGALVLHTLCHQLGEATFWPAVRAYLEAHRHQSVHTRDFQAALERSTGRNLDRFFSQWVHGAGHPELEVELERGEGTLTIKLSQKQSGPEVASAFHFDLPLLVVTDSGFVPLTLAVRERERAWTLPLQGRLRRVEVDSELRVLAELKLSGPRDLLLASLQGDFGVVGRIRAARALSRDRHPAASQALRQALVEQPFWGLRAEICALLGRLDADRAALISALRQDPHPRVRKAAANALGAWAADPVVIEALEALLDAGQEPALHVEGECLKSLGRLRAPTALARLEQAARRSSWADLLRARALEGLGATREAAALPLLVGYTTEAWGARTRTAAASALGQLADEVESVRTPAIEALIGLCRSAPFRTRLAAASALGRAGDPRGIAILDEVHASDRDGRTQRVAWEAARRIRKGRSSEAGLAGLREELEKVQAEARKLREGLTRLEQTAR